MKEEVQQAHIKTANSQSHCPSCGRFVGPYETCPYCGAHIEGRVPVRAVKLIAILLATVGLFALWWYARNTPIPTVSAAEALGTMNMAYVQVAGRVTRSITYDPDGGFLAFWLDDGTGEVRVTSYRDVTRALLAAGTIPAIGDEITVAGTLRIREDFVALTLNVAEHLELTRPAPLTLQSNEITILDEGLRARLSGEVRRVFEPYAGLTIITLHDAGGDIAITVNETLEQLTGELPEVVIGQGIEVEGTVTLYRDTPQIVPAAVADIVLSDAPPEEAVMATALPINQISAARQGEWVQVAGRVVALDGFRGGVKATLDDGTAQIPILLWDSVYSALDTPRALDIGADIALRGEVQVYQDAVEVAPQIAADIAIHTPAPPLPWIQARDLSAADAGRVVRLRGILGEPEGFSAGVKVPLDDGSGRITVLLWSNLALALEQRPAAGMVVEIAGVVAEFRGELEIIPRSPHDWQLAPED